MRRIAAAHLARLGRLIASDAPTFKSACPTASTATPNLAAVVPPVAAARLACARLLHVGAPLAASDEADAKPSLGGMPASDLRKTGSGGPHGAYDRDTELQQPETTTFREGIVNAIHAEQGATTDDSPEADHPAYKYQAAQTGGEARADDTGVSGMPTERPVATPESGLGNEPGANRPEPKGQAGLDSVPDELGANPHPHNEDATRQRWGDEEKEPLIRKTGRPEHDATGEPGYAADKGRHGSTELYDEKNMEALKRDQAPKRDEASRGVGP